jgi:uncharacterized protein with ATP-grasp and redox domains
VNIDTECLACIFNQALRVTKELDLDKKRAKEILDMSALMISKMSLDLTPPQNATPMYQQIAYELGVDDLYYDIKKKSIQKARSLAPLAYKILEDSSDKFATATKIAVVGNVIDLASEVSFDLDEELIKTASREFAIDDLNQLYEKIKTAKRVVYLADNAGENVFDQIYLEYLKKEFNELEIFYFVRGEPIINDLCINDLKDDPIKDVVTIINSGVKTPGIIYEDLNEDAKTLFDSADLIISKGMGNYECLSEKKEFPIFFLLKIKCNVVANSLNQQIGDIICKKI